MLRKFKGAFLIGLLGCGIVGAADVADLKHNPYHILNWTEAQREVWQVIETWNRAFAENDAEAYFHYISDDITVLTPSNPYRVEGKPDDREEFEYGIRTAYNKVGIFQEMTPLVRVYGDTAFATYFSRGYYGEVSTGGAMVYLKETDVLRRIDGQWKIVHVHVSK
jgi:ketosteroid isomerase-like protein